MNFACVLVLAGSISTLGQAGEPDPATPRTALDAYVEAARGVATWQMVEYTQQDGAKWMVVDLHSQTWRTAEEVSDPEWRHWMRMCVPDQRRNDLGLLVISGGARKAKAPGAVDGLVGLLAQQTGSVVIELPCVPNEPLVIDESGEGRYEDDLIAQSWINAERTGDEAWVVQLAMVQSAVAAMDAVEGILKDRDLDPLSGFIVTGASKRGWTTWLTAAVDPRVKAIMPIVFDALNMRESLPHHFAAYGFWAPALNDYTRRGIPQATVLGEFAELQRIVDPWHYRQRLSMPKFVLNAAGDQYFLPDGSQFYIDGFEGRTRLRYIPNADHGLTSNPSAVSSLIAFHNAVASRAEIPSLTWSVGEGELRVTASGEPSRMTVWHADNAKARDFRVETIGQTWRPEPLSPDSDGVYSVKLEAPEEGWRAWMVDAEFAVEGQAQRLVFSTPVWVVPDVLPFEDKVKAGDVGGD